MEQSPGRVRHSDPTQSWTAQPNHTRVPNSAAERSGGPDLSCRWEPQLPDWALILLKGRVGGPTQLGSGRTSDSPVRVWGAGLTRSGSRDPKPGPGPGGLGPAQRFWGSLGCPGPCQTLPSWQTCVSMWGKRGYVSSNACARHHIVKCYSC